MNQPISQWIRQFIKAMRVLSLTLALAATTMGILAAYRDGSIEDPTSGWSLLLIILITVAGLASQLGANLINDYFEGSFKYVDPSTRTLRFLGRDRTVFDVLVFLAGIAALGAAGLIGLYLVWISDWIMLVIGLLGLIGSYAYTGEPFVYKTKGLGVILSFILMGPLMLLGAYYPFSASLSWYPIILGMPVSLLVPAMMIANEMRDYSNDERLALGTLTTLIGNKAGLRLYEILIFGSLALTITYVLIGIYPLQALATLIVLPILIRSRNCVARHEKLGIPWTNRAHLLMLLIQSIVLIIW